MKIAKSKALTVNAPQFFQDPRFLAWLNNDEPKFTWHKKGAQPNDYSDVVVMVDPSLNGEGTDSDMPEHIWDQIVDACKVQFGSLPRGEDHIMVRLVNVEG
jgi:hypothetical protein